MRISVNVIQVGLEQYIEEEKIHDIFLEMMTSIIKERPSDPIQYLIDKLKKPESKFYKIRSYNLL